MYNSPVENKTHTNLNNVSIHKQRYTSYVNKVNTSGKQSPTSITDRKGEESKRSCSVWKRCKISDGIVTHGDVSATAKLWTPLYKRQLCSSM